MKWTVYDYAYFMAHESRWNTYLRGKATEVRVDEDGCITQAAIGGRSWLFGIDAVRAVRAARWRDDFDKWRNAREVAFDRWKHETPHRRYACERGCLALRLNGIAVILIHNGLGDGDFPVYRLGAHDFMPPCFSIVDMSIEDGTNVEVMPYDCPPYADFAGNAEPLMTFTAKGVMMVWAMDGAVVIKGDIKEG